MPHPVTKLPTNEELTAGKWMRFEYHKVTRHAFVMADAPGGKLAYQVLKDGKPDAGFRTFKPAKMILIEEAEPDWDHLPPDWQPLLSSLKGGQHEHENRPRTTSGRDH